MGNWRRVTRAEKCPVCGKPDWCLLATDGTAILCQRIESQKRCGDAGWLHRIGSANGRPHVAMIQEAKRNGVIDFAYLARTYARNSSGELSKAATSLGVSVASLRRLNAGYDGEAITFPMVNEKQNVCGIRRRFADGRKLSVKGGKEGVFRGYEETGPVVIVEGPTDAAAAITLGVQALGRPSCTGGTRIVAALLAGRTATIMADADGPGLAGAARLAKQLGCRVATPPDGHKDLRAWLRSGATAAALVQILGFSL
jgi:hypothetical protein